MQNLDLSFKHNLFTDEIIQIQPKIETINTTSRGAINSGIMLNSSISRGNQIIADRKTIDNIKNEIYRSVLKGDKNVQKSYKEDEEGPQMRPIPAKEEKEDIQNNDLLDYKNYETNLQMSIYNKYSGKRVVDSEIKKKVNEKYKGLVRSYYRGVQGDDILGGMQKINNLKKMPNIEPIYNNPIDDEIHKIELDEANLVETPYKKMKDPRFIRGIEMPEQIAKESKKFLNLEDNNEYDGLDRSTVASSNLNLDFGSNYDITN